MGGGAFVSSLSAIFVTVFHFDMWQLSSQTPGVTSATHADVEPITSRAIVGPASSSTVRDILLSLLLEGIPPGLQTSTPKVEQCSFIRHDMNSGATTLQR